MYDTNLLILKNVRYGGLMNLDELQPGQLATIIVSYGKEHMEFNTMLEDVYPKRRIICAAPVLKNEKPISFNSSAVQTHLVVFFEDKTPQIFYNVSIMLTRRDKTSVWYHITAPSNSIEYNRRKSYRCYLGIDTTVMIGPHHAAYDAILKDISVGGFSFTIDSFRSCDVGEMAHIILKDYIEELKESFTFSVYGIILTKRELENNRTVCGCRITSNTYGIDSYIAKKERIRLQKTRGGLTGSPASRHV